jgi:hypothetical protein
MRVILPTDNVVALGALQRKQSDATACEGSDDRHGDRNDWWHWAEENIKRQLSGLPDFARLDYARLD